MINKMLNFIIMQVMAIYGKYSYKRYIKMSKNANAISEKVLKNLVSKNENTDFGKKHNFSKINNITDYQNIMPYTKYDDYKEYIEDTIETGTQNHLIKDNIKYFAHTSGTTGVTKMIPVVNKSYKPYLHSASIFFWNLKNEYKKKFKFFHGRGLNTIETETEVTKSGIKTGFISGYALASAKKIIPLTTCLPKEVFSCGEDADMKYIKARYALEDKNLIYLMAVFMSTLTDLINYIIENHEMLIEDIENGVINSSIKIDKEVKEKLERKLKPNKKRAEELKDIFHNNEQAQIIPRIWPKMSLIIAISTGEFSPFDKKMRYYCGESISFSYEMYASSESLIATSLYPETKDYMLVVDGGFYEFIPVDDAKEKVLTMKDLEIGKKYEIVVTNLSGLYRYRIKDVVTVTGFLNETPLVQFAYRKEQIINMGGVHLTIEHIQQAITDMEKKIKNNILDYSIYVDHNHVPSRMILYIELKDNSKKYKKINEQFDNIIASINNEHGRMLRIGESSESIVNIVKRGTYSRYRDGKIKKGFAVNQIKTVRFIDTEEKLNYFNNNILVRGDVNE